ncbi:molybdate ABC transporter substrate-binding protein [Streptomyces chumphonensis]|uniref:Molybdate ABC transporter substrate-binding protein n=1 Tax=Streptomyces chumphonensis TaxID=1214925 RepID=A0A927ICF9_9ACTN|nr:molybdate ABC transporter substrate-binding protein [Streptomyces chumphonensis]MBD3933973.1 molybdate ABC transporter substrate-binding protein [Streptomyces chumphonensis]
MPAAPPSALRRRATTSALAAALLLPLAACGAGGGGADAATTELTVLAASSLTDAFEQAGAAYSEDHPGTTVTFSFAGSQELTAQVRQGAPADVIATASAESMADVAADAGEPVTFAENRLVIVTGEGNPHGVKTLADLADADLTVVLAAPEVPVGAYGQDVLDRQGIDVEPASEEPNVRAVLSKVALGEADAGLVYRTDAATSPDTVDAVEIPDAQNAVAAYPAATLDAAEHPKEAAAFVEWLRGPRAQRILAEYGFQQP